MVTEHRYQCFSVQWAPASVFRCVSVSVYRCLQCQYFGVPTNTDPSLQPVVFALSNETLLKRIDYKMIEKEAKYNVWFLKISYPDKKAFFDLRFGYRSFSTWAYLELSEVGISIMLSDI